MFSGIVEEKGIVQKVDRKKNLITMAIRADRVLRATKIGRALPSTACV